MPAGFAFEFGMARGKPREETPTRLLLLGDFSARAQRSQCDPASIIQRRTVHVDIDTLDRAIARFSPTLQVTLADGTPFDLRPTSLDDFHPDRLVARVPVLQRLALLRRRMADAGQFAGAVADFRKEFSGAAPGERAAAADAGSADVPSNLPAARSSPGATADESDDATLGRLLGGRPAGVAPASPSAASTSAAERSAEAIIRRALSPGDLARDTRFQAEYLAAVDALAAQSLRALLHQSNFRELEAVWRGVGWLVSRLELSEDLELHLLDVSLEELRADAAAAAAPEATALARRFSALAEDAATAGASWGLAAGLFSMEVRDVGFLARLGVAAQRLHTPLVLGAGPGLAGIGSDPSVWESPVEAGWQPLRDSAAGGALALVAPRFLLRLPYGRATDPIETFSFDELGGGPPAREKLLWAEPSLAALLTYARSLLDDGGGTFDIDDLPAVTYTEDGERQLAPCAEWLLSERVGERMSDHGIMPLLGSRHRNAVRLAAWHTLSTAGRR